MALFLPATVAAVHRAMTRRTGLDLGARRGARLRAGASCRAPAPARRGRCWRPPRYGRCASASPTSWPPLGRPGAAPAPGPAPAASWPRRQRGPAGSCCSASSAGGAGGHAALPTALALRGRPAGAVHLRRAEPHFLAEPSMFQRLDPPQPGPPHRRRHAVRWASSARPLPCFAVVGVLSAAPAGRLVGPTLRGRRCLLVMVGTPLTWLAWRFVPAMDVFRPYTRLIVFAAFGMVVAGAHRPAGRARRRRPPCSTSAGTRLAAGATLAVAAIVTSGHRGAADAPRARPRTPRSCPTRPATRCPDTPSSTGSRADGDANGWPAAPCPCCCAGQTPPARPPHVVRQHRRRRWASTRPAATTRSVRSARTMTLLRVLQRGRPRPGLSANARPPPSRPAYDSWSARFDLLRPVRRHRRSPPPPRRTGADLRGTRRGRPRRRAGLRRTPTATCTRCPVRWPGPRLVAAEEVVQRRAGRAAPLRRSRLRSHRHRGRSSRASSTAPGRTASHPTAAPAPSGDGPRRRVRAVRGVNTVTVDVTARRAGVAGGARRLGGGLVGHRGRARTRPSCGSTTTSGRSGSSAGHVHRRDALPAPRLRRRAR